MHSSRQPMRIEKKDRNRRQRLVITYDDVGRIVGAKRGKRQTHGGGKGKTQVHSDCRRYRRTQLSTSTLFVSAYTTSLCLCSACTRKITKKGNENRKMAGAHCHKFQLQDPLYIPLVAGITSTRIDPALRPSALYCKEYWQRAPEVSSCCRQRRLQPYDNRNKRA